MIETGGILKAYKDVDEHLAERESKTRTPVKRAYWANIRVLNDHAYFLLIFGRFEQYIDEQCERLLAKRTSARQWKRRRVWDELDLERMKFRQKIALLVEKGNAEFNRVFEIYRDIRCPIAHGANSSVDPFLLSTLANELRELSSRFRAS